MNGDLQTRIKPHTSPTSRDFSQAKVSTLNPKAIDSSDENKTSFKDLLLNSNEDQARMRAAQKNGDALKAAKTDEEFAKMMMDKANKDNLRVPSNKLDKDAFLKLFITQLQNQDPLSPDDSSQMASQLAQFDGLEQMLNVNKNLEKLKEEQALGRAVDLIGFVGKDVKLDNGKLSLKAGKLTDASFEVEKDMPKATLEVRDSAGVVLTTKDLGYLKKGAQKVEWDGLDKNGQKVADGAYTFHVVGKDLQGMDIPVKITSTVKVTGVDLTDQGGSFYTDLGKIRVTEIASVGDAGFLGAAMNAAPAKAAPAQEAVQAAKDLSASPDIPPEVLEEMLKAAGMAATPPAPKDEKTPPKSNAAAPAADSAPDAPKSPNTSAIPDVIDIPVPGASS